MNKPKDTKPDQVKVKPSQIGTDARFQRDLDESRAKRMGKHLDVRRIGHPVVSVREDGSMVALDGQHRLQAMRVAGVDDAILCDAWHGLTLAEEAELFILLQADRKAVRVYDKFKARLVARDPVALEIEKIVKAAGLRIAKAQGNNCICAIKALESAHARYRNLPKSLSVLLKWSDGDPGAFDGHLITDVACFLAQHPKVDLIRLAEKLAPYSPERILSRIRRVQGNSDELPRGEAACRVFREIYNYRSRDKLQAPKKAA